VLRQEGKSSCERGRKRKEKKRGSPHFSNLIIPCPHDSIRTQHEERGKKKRLGGKKGEKKEGEKKRRKKRGDKNLFPFSLLKPDHRSLSILNQEKGEGKKRGHGEFETAN